MSAEEYASLSEDERLNDSLYYVSLQYCGLDEELLKQYDEFKDFDFERSRRLADEYIARHPELSEELSGL